MTASVDGLARKLRWLIGSREDAYRRTRSELLAADERGLRALIARAIEPHRAFRLRLAGEVLALWLDDPALCRTVAERMRALPSTDPTADPIVPDLDVKRRAAAIVALGGAVLPRVLELVLWSKGFERVAELTVLHLALQKLRSPRAVPPLLAVLRSEREPIERELAVETLGELRDPRAIEPLVAVLEAAGEDVSLRRASIRALVRCGDPRAVGPLLRVGCADEAPSALRAAAITALGSLGAAAVEPELLQLLSRARDQVVLVQAVADTLSRVGGPTALTAIADLAARHPDPYLRARVAAAAARLGARLHDRGNGE